MKFFTSVVGYVTASRTTRQNLGLLLRYFFFLAVMVTAYSLLFHFIMEVEGKQYSWLTGFYWTLTVMTTLGFGDITFQSDLGRAFSIFVLLSGLVSLLVLLPFTFIEFFYAPFMRAQSRARVPRELPHGRGGHVILTHIDAVTRALIDRLKAHGDRYVLLVPDMQAALELVEEGLDVVAGELDDPETYRRVNVDRAPLVVATGTDMLNTNIAFTVREQDARVPILATARSREAGEILQLAGCTQVIRLGKMLGEAFARRTIGGDARAHVIGQMDELLVAEASAAGTPLVGKLLRDTRLRETTGINIVGISERGRFAIPRPDTAIGENSILVLAGSAEHIERYNELFCIYHVTTGRVIIVGAGRVGRSVAEAMEERGTDYCLIDVIGEKVPDPGRAVIGNAADSRVLERAGIRDAPAVVITTRDDDMNIYLTIFCRKLRKDIQIISRATAERNVATLYRAGADIVMSYASMGSNLIYNYYRHSDVVMLAGGLNVFRSGVPKQLVGRSLAESDIRRLTGCNVAAIRTPERFLVNPNPQEILAGGCELVLIGTEESERAFLRLFG